LLSAFELAKLFKMFAMAEYYESQHAQSFWDKFRNNVHTLSQPTLAPTMLLAHYVWPDFDREAFQLAIASYQQRERRYGRTSEQLKA